MRTYKARQAEKVFTKLAIQEGSSNHHRRGFLVDDTTGVKLYPPIYFNKGRGDIYPKIAQKLRISLGLDTDEFDRLMCCTMPKDEYFALRRSRDKKLE
jgi:hypothetical protein